MISPVMCPLTVIRAMGEEVHLVVLRHLNVRSLGAFKPRLDKGRNLHVVNTLLKLHRHCAPFYVPRLG